MTAPVKRRATYADLEAVSPLLVAEIIDGDLVTHPRPTPPHVLAANRLYYALTGPFDIGRGAAGWIFMVEPELHLGHDVVVPDIAGWRRERLPRLPDTAYIATRPDWVCEVLSPTTERYDRGTKRRIYAGAEVPFLWLLDPRSRVLEAFVLAAGKWLLSGTWQDDEQVSAPPFEAEPFALESLWPFDEPDSTGTAPAAGHQPEEGQG